MMFRRQVLTFLGSLLGFSVAPVVQAIAKTEPVSPLDVIRRELPKLSPDDIKVLYADVIHASFQTYVKTPYVDRIVWGEPVPDLRDRKAMIANNDRINRLREDKGLPPAFSDDGGPLTEDGEVIVYVQSNPTTKELMYQIRGLKDRINELEGRKVDSRVDLTINFNKRQVVDIG
jgi:hypothetical protein